MFQESSYKRNLSVVLNELTKAPFEPMKDTDIKHLTLKTAFLLALASGKWRSEIHDWVANKVSNLGQWEKVALFPSSDFIAKNQLAREGSQSVSPVMIPALTSIVDRQFKDDRTLCPVWPLRYYLDRTKDLRGSRSLLFISFKKGHTSDIRGHGGRVVTLSTPTSEAGVRFPARPQVGKLVVACRCLAVYSTEP